MLRIDDIGASTKHYNQHGKKQIKLGSFSVPVPFANVGKIKTIEPFRGWAPYDELTVPEWEQALTVFQKYGIKPVVAVTACWVSEDSKLIPFPEKFPDEAKFLKTCSDKGLIVIANHGLTHCVVGRHLPRFWSSNRNFHREFWPWLDSAVHEEHVKKSQEILENYFEKPVTIFVPPGNIWSEKTYHAFKNTNIDTVISANYMSDSTVQMDGVQFTDDRTGWINIHDRDIKLYGSDWLEKLIKKS